MKGQFFWPAMFVMAVVIIGIAYFASEGFPQQPEETLLEAQMASFKSSLQLGLETKAWTENNTFITFTITQLQEQAEQTGRDFTADCYEAKEDYGYTLNCTLILRSGSQNITSTLNYSYAIPMDITLYNDSEYTEEDYEYLDTDTVYLYAIDGTAGREDTIEVFDGSGALFETYVWNTDDGTYQTSFVPDASWDAGNWTVYMQDELMTWFDVTATGPVITVTTYSDPERIVESSVFNPGNTIYYKVESSTEGEHLIQIFDVNEVEQHNNVWVNGGENEFLDEYTLGPFPAEGIWHIDVNGENKKEFEVVMPGPGPIEP